MRKKKFFFDCGLPDGCNGCYGTRKRASRHYGSYTDGHLVFRARHEINLRHWCCGRVNRRGESIWKVQQRGPRHVKDGGVVVRSLHFPDCGGHYPAFLLLVKLRIMDLEINKGIGRNVEFKGTGKPVPFHLLLRSARRVRGIRHPVHGGCEPVGVHWLRCSFSHVPCMAHLPPERDTVPMG